MSLSSGLTSTCRSTRLPSGHNSRSCLVYQPGPRDVSRQDNTDDCVVVSGALSMKVLRPFRVCFSTSIPSVVTRVALRPNLVLSTISSDPGSGQDMRNVVCILSIKGHAAHEMALGIPRPSKNGHRDSQRRMFCFHTPHSAVGHELSGISPSPRVDGPSALLRTRPTLY